MASFSIGATCWSRRDGALLWSLFDRGELRESVQQLASIGVDTVRLPLHWEEFQPRPERVDVRTLRLLEQALALADDARLRVVPSLLPLAIGGAVHLPAWTTADSFAADLELATKFGPLLIVRSDTRPPLVWERTRHDTEVRDLWTNPAMRAAQRRLIAEVVGNFADHGAISGWEIGHGVEMARVPSSAGVFGEWLGETVDMLREHGARGDLFYAATLRSLSRREGPRPESIVEARAVPVLSVVPPEPLLAATPLTADALRFVAALVASLCGTAPVLLLGAPAIANAQSRSFVDQAYGAQIQQPLLDHDQYAELIEGALPDLRAHGVPGVWFAHAWCYAAPFVPAEAHSRREQMMGLFDTTGEDLPVARAVQVAAAQPAPESITPLPRLDVEDYWDDPAASARRLWKQWRAAEDEP